MAITGEEFKMAAMELVTAWKSINMPPLQWHSFQSPHGLPPSDSVGGYLALQDVLVANASSKAEEKSEVEDLEDDISTAYTEEPHYHLYTYHILYNESYRVPKLFFIAHFTDGRQLDLEQVQLDLPQPSCEELKRHPWTFLTLEDHPYLNSPWFTLHPCGTSEMMSIMRKSSVSKSGAEYLLTWLSMIAEAVGLDLNSDTFCKLSQCKGC